MTEAERIGFALSAATSQAEELESYASRPPKARPQRWRINAKWGAVHLRSLMAIIREQQAALQAYERCLEAGLLHRLVDKDRNEGGANG